jgi:hypothetical protein
MLVNDPRQAMYSRTWRLVKDIASWLGCDKHKVAGFRYLRLAASISAVFMLRKISYEQARAHEGDPGSLRSNLLHLGYEQARAYEGMHAYEGR